MTDALFTSQLDSLLTSTPLPESRALRERSKSVVNPKFTRFSELPAYKQIQVQKLVAEKMRVRNLFFTCHDGLAQARTRIGGKEYLNFSTYDYLGLNSHPEVRAAACSAVGQCGVSAGASRLVAGERPQHRALEKALAAFYGTADALVFVSGHATNVSVLATLFNARDAVYHDALAHNSLIMGAACSGAARHSFAHNDAAALGELLRRTRAAHERAVIVTEGLFSMDGSVAALPEFIALKREYGCFLMVDEAHALGTLGSSGKGSAEHCGAPAGEVDIWMGTLSKSLCGCGGFIAGCAELIELLKYGAPGFVYSVGMSPPLAAASSKALELLQREPERVRRLQEVSDCFLRRAAALGLNTGHAIGRAVVPLIVGNSLVTAYLSALLFDKGVNVMPVVYPAVEEDMARLRFFLSSEHREEDVNAALTAVREALPKAIRKFQ